MTLPFNPILPNQPPWNNQQSEEEDEDEEDLPSMTFEEALQLVEAINESVGWSAEICASGMDDYEYITVQACFDLFGLIYQVDLESLEEWEYHLKRITMWVNTTHPQKGSPDDHVL